MKDVIYKLNRSKKGFFPELPSIAIFISGYYCPLGSSVETQIICPIGKHCPEGSSEPVDCLEGSYSGATGQVTCTECPEGISFYAYQTLHEIQNLKKKNMWQQGSFWRHTWEKWSPWDCSLSDRDGEVILCSINWKILSKGSNFSLSWWKSRKTILSEGQEICMCDEKNVLVIVLNRIYWIFHLNYSCPF